MRSSPTSFVGTRFLSMGLCRIEKSSFPKVGIQDKCLIFGFLSLYPLYYYCINPLNSIKKKRITRTELAEKEVYKIIKKY